MLSNVSNLNYLNSSMLGLKMGCYGVSLFYAGRKVTQLLASGTYMAASKVANYK